MRRVSVLAVAKKLTRVPQDARRHQSPPLNQGSNMILRSLGLAIGLVASWAAQAQTATIPAGSNGSPVPVGANPTQSTALVINVPAGGDVVSAVAQVDNAGGGTVNLAAGVYNITSSIVIGSNVTINGQGSSTVIYNPQTPNGVAMIQAPVGAISNVIIENLVLDGNVPKGAFGQSGEYANSGIFVNDTISPASNILVKNVEIRNFGDIGILMIAANSITFNNIYVHDNNYGNFAHNIYLVGCSFVYFTHSRSSHALTGDGLHFDFNASYYLISKSEFSNNHGEGILDQGGTAIYIQDSIFSWNVNDGLNASSNGELLTRSIADENGGQGFNIQGSEASFDLVDIPNGGFDYFSQAGALGNFLGGTNSNQYLAILANGVTGATDTADWVTDLSTQQAGGYQGGPALSGYSSVGVVDFNMHHLSDGLLTFPSVGVVGGGQYSTTWAYSNGSGSTVTMALTINGVSAGTISFPPTTNWSTWSTVNVLMQLHDGGNSVSVSPQGSAAPLLNYFNVNTSVPQAPAVPTGVAVTALSPYSTKTTWDPVVGASSYDIYRSGVQIAVGVTGTSYTDTDILQASSTYSYQVVAVNQGGNSSFSPSVTVTTPTDAPAGLTGSASGTGNGFGWLSANGAVSYNVLRSYVSGGPYTTIATTTQTSYSDTTATPLVTAYYVVEAVNAAGATSGNSYELGLLTQVAASTFLLTDNRTALTLQPGSGGMIGITVNDGSGFSGPVNFSVSGLPSTVVSNFTATSSSSGTTLNLNLPANTPPGTYTITVTGTAGSISNSNTVTLIVPAPQTITFGAIGSQPVGATLALTASASSGLPITYNSQTPTVCGVSGAAATMLTAGTCTLVASQLGNATINAATSVTQSFDVLLQGFTLNLANPTLTVLQGAGSTDAISVALLPGFNGTVAYTVSGLPTGVTDSVSSNSLALSVASNTVPGSYPVTITGTSGGFMATTYLTLTVASPLPQSQTLTFPAPGNQSSATTLTLVATASSGLAVSFASTTPAVCTVTGTTATLLTAGKCTIVAAQGGNGSYAAATPVTQSFTVTTPSFTLSSAATTVMLQTNSTVTEEFTVVPRNGFSGTVGYSVAGIPSGVTSSLSGNSLMLSASKSSVPGTYPLLIVGVSGTATAQLDLTLVIAGSPQTAVDTPTMTLAASPTTIILGGSISLSWSSKNTSSCAATGGAWTGSQPLTGTILAVPNSVGTATYTLTCAGIGGSTSASTTVTVAEDPTITVVAKKTSSQGGGGGSLDLWSLGGLLAVGAVAARRRRHTASSSGLTGRASHFNA
jgi:hypothetical protein